MSPEGLIYRDFVEGEGEPPADGQEVTFDYTAYNESGARGSFVGDGGRRESGRGGAGQGKHSPGFISRSCRALCCYARCRKPKLCSVGVAGCTPAVGAWKGAQGCP